MYVVPRSPLLAIISGMAGIIATDLTLVLEISRYVVVHCPIRADT